MNKTIIPWSTTLHNTDRTQAIRFTLQISDGKGYIDIKRDGDNSITLVAKRGTDSNTIYLSEITVEGHTLPFSDAVLIPGNPIPGDTWELSASKRIKIIASIDARLRLRVISLYDHQIALQGDLMIIAKALVSRKYNFTGTIWLTHHYQPVRFEAEGEVYT